MKNKTQQTTGWLDNFNDSKVSLPPGFVGEGTFNGPQWESPAWGGQFEDGGQIPQAQKGYETLPPVFIESKSDPRYKAYQDSLKMYNLNGPVSDLLYKAKLEGSKMVLGYSRQVHDIGYPDRRGYNLDNFIKANDNANNFIKNIKNPRGIKPSVVNPNYKNYNEYARSIQETITGNPDIRRNQMMELLWKKPTQPYILGKPPEPQPSLKKKVTKIEPIPSKGKSTTPQLRTIEQPNIELPAVQMGKYRTSYYDPQMKDWNEKAFMSQEESDQFANEMSQRGYPGSYGNVTQRKQYAMGGSFPGSVGFTYARTQGAAPSNGPYAKKTKASAQNGKEMSYYQHGLDWKPKSISRDGSIIPKAQDGKTFEELTGLKPITSLTKSGESTSLGTKIDEAAIRQASIDSQRRKQGQIRKAEPDRSAASKAWAIATHPMTALAYKVKGQDIPEHFERGEINPLDYAIDIINPATYLEAAGRTAHNITSPKEMFYRTLNSIEGDDNMLDVAGDALLTAGIPGLTKSTLGTLDRNFSNVGKQLEKIRFEGEAKGLSPHEIAKQQMQEVGITSNQRKAYTPILSDFAEKYITPYGYEGMEGKSKLQQTIDNIRKGGLKNRKINLNKDIIGPFDRTEIRPERSDAWRLYLGKPQEYNTFKIAETAPVNHSSYSPEQLANMDIYSINSEYAKLGIKPNTAFPELISPSRIEDNMDLLRKKISIDKGNEIMGGYNKRLNQYGLEYNDKWDLQPHIVPRNYLPNLLKNTLGESSLFIKTLPNGVQIPRSFKIDASRVLGKPFMSHEVLPYTSNDLTREMNNVFDYQIQKLKESPYDMTPKIQKMEAYKEELKNYPKQKKGGVIEDDRGQWAHPGKITKINSNQITMKGVDYPVLGVSDQGDTQMMYPEQEYTFKGKNVTEIPMAQKGNLIPTTQDSLNLYNSQMALNKFYENEMKTGRIKKDETMDYYPGGPNNPTIMKNRNLKFYRGETAWRNEHGSGVYDDQYKKIFNLTPEQVKGLEYKGIGMSKAGNEYQTYYKDLITPLQNLASPFAMFDSRIAPQREISYKGIGNYPGGKVTVFDYDPLAIKPYHLRTPKEKIEWEKKYGKGISKKEQSKPGEWKPLTPDIAKGHFSGDISKAIYRETGNPEHPYDITGAPVKPKPEPKLKKKVSNVNKISVDHSSSLPGITSIQNPNIEIPNIPTGKYKVSYWDPEMKDWNERGFTTKEESDKFFNEAPTYYQTKQYVEKKSTGGWLEKYN